MISQTTKLKLEEEIELLAQEYSACVSDKKNMRDRVLVKVHEYYGKLYPDFKDDYNLECVRVVDTCLGNYDPAKGKFVYYLKSSMKHMLKFDPDSPLRYKRVKESDTDNSETEDNPGNIAAHYKLCELPFSSYVITDEDGNDSSFVDTVQDNGRDFTEIINSDMDVRRMLRAIDRVYLQQQKRQQKYLRIALTSAIFDAFGGTCFGYGVENLNFFSNSVYELCEKKGRPLKDKEIALMTDMKDGNYSRAFKAFKEKLILNDEFIELVA